jgi:hypothetical protein
MAETWLDRGIRFIESLDRQLPADMPLEERKRAIGQHAWRFTGGTSWGSKVWPKAKRAYFSARYNDRPRSDAAIPPKHLSPLERLMAKANPTGDSRG